MRRPPAASLLALLLASAPVIAAGAAAEAGVASTSDASHSATTRAVTVTGGTFSPNRDGSKDSLAIRYHLPRPVDEVELQISEFSTFRRATVRTVRLGSADKGSHRWTWDGRDDRGRVVDDGRYTVVLSHSGGLDPARDRIIVDTYFSPRLAISPGPEEGQEWNPSIYPRSTVVRDALDLVVRHDQGDHNVRRLSVAIRAPGGRAVWRRAVRDVRAEPWTGEELLAGRWTGRARGRALPPGRYRAVMSGIDRAGNRARAARTIWVSKERLAWRERTLEVSPQASMQDYCAFFTIGNACGEGPPTCGEVVPSAIHPGALTYRSRECATGTPVVYALHHVGLAAARVRGIAEARVAFSGGPTTPGEDDQGTLVVEAGGPGQDVAVTGSTSARSPWVECPLTCLGWWTGYGSTWLEPGVAWTFGTRDGDSVDVATYTVDLRFLVVDD